MRSLDAAIDEYLTYLDVERGLSPATIRAYRADLHDYEASRGVTRAWAASPDGWFLVPHGEILCRVAG